MSGCLIMLLSGPAELEPTHLSNLKQNKASKVPIARVYAMRGLWDVFSMGMNSLAEITREKLGLQATVLSYYEEKRLSDFLIEEYQSGRYRGPIILIGHSYGADEQITVAKRLNQKHVPVHLLITLDLTERQTIPPNVKSFYNISSGKSILGGIIPWGVPLVAESKTTRVVNINLAKDKPLANVNHLNIDKLSVVQTYVLGLIKSSIIHQ